MLLLQFSTSHYCRKARLALGYKKISYQRYYIEHWYHPIIPDEDYQAEKFFHFQSKRILSSSTLKLNLKFIFFFQKL